MAGPVSIEFDFRGKRYQDAATGLRAYADAIKSDWDGSAKVLSAQLRTFLDSVAKALSTRHGRPWPGGTSTNTLSKRSGTLVDSIIKSVDVKGTTFTAITGSIGSDTPYANIQELGGTITPKKAKYLAIPLPAALNANGTPKVAGPRAWDNTFVARSKAGNLIIFQRKLSQIIPLYVLKSSVYIPPRLGLRKTLDAGLPYFVDKTMDAIVKAINQSKKA